MKHCGYCGRENGDDAVYCQECGTEFVREPIIADPIGSLERIATLDTEVQAGLVDAVLSERQIPHVMQTYHDSAYDGIFQLQKGWAVVLAPAHVKAEILAVINDVKRQSSGSTGSSA